MVRTLFLSSLVLVSACGRIEESTRSKYGVPPTHRGMPELQTGDDELAMIANEFYADAAALGKKTASDFRKVTWIDKYSDDKPNTIGECTFWSNEKGEVVTKDVTFLKSYWDNAPYGCKKALVYHEFGHCALNLEHTPDGSGNIMDPMVPADCYQDASWTDLVKAEFSESKLGLSLADSVDSDVVHITLH